MIDFNCLKCGEELSVPDSLAGEMQVCPACGEGMPIPAVRRSLAAPGTPAPQKPASEPPAATLSSRSVRAILLGGLLLVILVVAGVLIFLAMRRSQPGPGERVVVVCAGGAKVRFLRADGKAIYEMKPAPRIKTIEWLPDRRAVAVVSAAGSQLVDVARLASDGDAAVRACPALDAMGAVPAISPDGRQVAFVLKDRLFVVPAGNVSLSDLLEDDGPQVAAGLSEGAKAALLDRGGVRNAARDLLDIAWSPDGSAVAMTTRDVLFIHSPADGKTRSFQAPAAGRGNLFWDREGRCVFSWRDVLRNRGVWRFEPKAGTSEKVLDSFGASYCRDLDKFLYMETYLGVPEGNKLSCRALFACRQDGSEKERLGIPVDTEDTMFTVRPDFTFRSLWRELEGVRTFVYHDWYNDDKMTTSNTIGISGLKGDGYKTLRDAMGAAVPHVTPDKKHLCYKLYSKKVAHRAVEQEFVRMHGATGRKETMPLGEKAPGKLVSWTPDASRLAFKKLNPNAPPTFIIYDFNQKKSVAEVKMRTYGYDSVTWSPDGNRLAFLYGQYQNQARCFVCNTTAKGATKVEFPAEHGRTRVMQVVWSPDGSRLALLLHSTIIDMYLADGDGRNPTKFQSIPLNAATQISRVAWHPDGDRLTLAGLIFQVGAGAAKTKPPKDAKTVGQSYWTPDGRHFVRYETGNVSIYQLPYVRQVSLGRLFIGDADGGNMREINPTPRFGHIERGPSWSPDGRFVAYLGSCHGFHGYCFFVASLDPSNGQVAVLPIEKQKPFAVLWK